MKLRPYQIELSKQGAEILRKSKFVCLFMQVRTGKTITALEICNINEFVRVLFITKIKAFKSIENDASHFDFETTIINRESLHKIKTNNFDCVIVDESHGYSSYPKPSKYFTDVNDRFGNHPMILLSGTPTPESFSQYYHQFTLSNNSVFKNYRNFYAWAKDFVDIKQRNLGYATVNDYSDCKIERFEHLIKPFILSYTQKESGFISKVNETILNVDMSLKTLQIIDVLKRDLVVKCGNKVILADTSVKLQQKLHQLYSGTCKFENGTSQIIDNSKALFIKDYFNGKKIGIFYNFVEELAMLQQVYGSNLTTDLNEFNETGKNIALQIVSGREGISLKNADCLVMFNISFSAVSYWQSRDRLTTMERKENSVFWIFSKGGMEHKIYKAVMNKKNFTNRLFLVYLNGSQ